MLFPFDLVPMTAPTPEDFVPPGWAIAGDSGITAKPAFLAPNGSASGDLTGDGVADRVLVLEPAARVEASAVATCESCEPPSWTRAIVVVEAVGTGWVQLAVAGWGDPSTTARIHDGRLVVTSGVSGGKSRNAELLRYRLDGRVFRLEHRVFEFDAFSFDDISAFERVTEDWVAHLRIIEKGEPPSEAGRQKFAGDRSFAEGSPRTKK